MYVELKPESDPKTPLQDREPSTAEVPSPSSSDLSPIQFAGFKEESHYSDKLKNESVPNFLSIQRGMKTVRVGNKYHAKKMKVILLLRPNPLLPRAFVQYIR